MMISALSLQFSLVHIVYGYFRASNFNVGADYTKATFSPDAEYIACGSSDGSVYIWNVAKNKVETVLKEHK